MYLSPNRDLVSSLSPDAIKSDGKTRETYDCVNLLNSTTYYWIVIPDDGIILDDVERNIIIAGLNKSGWNKAKAARLLGISRPTIYQKIKEYKLTKPTE